MMAAGKPLFVWDTPVWDHMGQEYAVPASSVPYWSYECGERLVDKDSLDLALDHFLGRLTTYTPRAYVDRELSPEVTVKILTCLLYTSPSPRDGLLSRMPSSA